MASSNLSLQSENELELQALRQTNALRLITPDQEGIGLSALPNGIYGYTYSPAGEETPLFAEKTFQCFEMHKLHGGGVRLLGYVTPEEHRQIEAGHEPLECNLYPAPNGASSRIIAISLARVAKVKPPSRSDGNYTRIDLNPAEV